MNTKQILKRAQRRPTIFRDERGLSTVEYVVLLVLICAGCVGLWASFGKDLVKKLGDASGEFHDEVNMPDPDGGEDNDPK